MGTLVAADLKDVHTLVLYRAPDGKGVQCSFYSPQDAVWTHLKDRTSPHAPEYQTKLSSLIEESGEAFYVKLRGGSDPITIKEEQGKEVTLDYQNAVTKITRTSFVALSYFIPRQEEAKRA